MRKRRKFNPYIWMETGVLGGGGLPAPAAATALLVDGNGTGQVADSYLPEFIATASADDTAKDGSTHTYTWTLTLNGSNVALDNASGLTGTQIEAGYTVDPTVGSNLLVRDAAYTATLTTTRVSDSATSSTSITFYVTPASLGTLEAFYDPTRIDTLYQDSAGTTPVTANSDPIGRWLDLSGDNNHATQSTTANKLTYNTSGAPSSASADDDAGDFLAAPLAMSVQDNWTLVSVHRPTELTQNRRIVFGMGAQTNGYAIASSGDTAGRISVLFGGVAWRDTTTDYTLNVWHIIAAIRNTGTMTIYSKNTALAPTRGDTPAVPTTRTEIGGNGTLNFKHQGNMGCQLAYSTALSAAQYAALVEYLEDKHGI